MAGDFWMGGCETIGGVSMETMRPGTLLRISELNEKDTERHSSFDVLTFLLSQR